MAVMFLNSRRAWWKIHIAGVDATDVVGPFVSGFTVRDTILPKPRSGKSEYSPSEADIKFTSKDYIEDWFIPGASIVINAGYDRIRTPKVFEGIITSYPDGQAKEMLNYTVKAYGDSSKLGLKEKIRTFTQTRKADVIAQIASENGWGVQMSIKDSGPFKEQFTPIQSGKTDLQFLWECATKWRCAIWFDQSTKTLYFCDADIAHKFKPLVQNPSSLTTGGFGKPDITAGIYNLGYRNDYVKNNVDSVKWKHSPARGAEAADGGISGFGEIGDTFDKFGKILALGQTWELKPEYRREAMNRPWLFAKFVVMATKLTVQGQGYEALKKFYTVVPFGDNAHNPITTGGGDTGFEIDVELKEGNPDVKPPFRAKLYYGSYMYNADSSFLPRWLANTNKAQRDCINLFVNTTELSLDNGMLQSKFNCSILRD